MPEWDGIELVDGGPRPRGLLLIWVACILGAWAVVAILAAALYEAVGAVL